MSSVVFLRAVNVGTTNRCRPAAIARELTKKFDIVNIGAAGTFIVRGQTNESALRAAIARELPFQCEIMICSGEDLLSIARIDPFLGEPAGAKITHFANIMAKPLAEPPPLPLFLPSKNDWLVKLISIRKQFALGLYRREMKAIRYLGKLEKVLGVAATNRNWTTIEKIRDLLAAPE